MSLERIQGIVADGSSVAVDADAAAALDRALSHIAAGDRADSRDGKYSFNQSATEFDDAFFGPQTTFDNGFDVLSQFVDDVVATNLDVAFIGQCASAFVGNHIEADDYRVR